MTIASGGTLGTGTNSTSNASYTFNTATNTLAAGDFGLLVNVTDNTSTTDGNNNEHTSVSGGTGTWTKLGEHTNSNGVAAAGVTVSVWLFEATGTVGTGTTITLGFASNRTDKTCSFWKFTKASGARVILDTEPGTNPITSDVDASNGFGSSAFSGLSTASRLYFRGLGKEANSTTGITVSTSFTAITGQRSRNNASAVLVRGEFRINASTGETSNPTLAVSGDTAGLFLALREVYQYNAPSGGAVAAGEALTAKVPYAPVATSGPLPAYRYYGATAWRADIGRQGAGGSSTYTWVGSGVAIAGGSAALAKIKAYAPSGGAVAGGTAAVAKIKHYGGSGGALTAGAAARAKTKAYAAAGGAIAGGAATTAKVEPGATTYAYTGSGGAIAGGAAALAKTKAYAATGGAVTGGAATTARVAGLSTYAWTGSGGAVTGGAAETDGPVEEGGAGYWIPAPLPRPAKKPAAPVPEISPEPAPVAYAYAGSGGASTGGAAVTAYVRRVLPPEERKARTQRALFLLMT